MALDLEPEMTTDSLQLFFKGIGKVRLLTGPEEVELAKRIERWTFVASPVAAPTVSSMPTEHFPLRFAW